jgi:hypothetical protein
MDVWAEKFLDRLVVNIEARFLVERKSIDLNRDCIAQQRGQALESTFREWSIDDGASLKLN